MAAQNTAPAIISDYAGSLFASMETFWALNILTEHNFFYQNKYNTIQNFSPPEKNPPPLKKFYKMNKYGILSKKRIYFHSSLILHFLT